MHADANRDHVISLKILRVLIQFVFVCCKDLFRAVFGVSLSFRSFCMPIKKCITLSPKRFGILSFKGSSKGGLI